MGERVARVNDCKVELKRCSHDELYAMAEDAMLRVQVAEIEVSKVAEELRRRSQEAVMGEPSCYEG